MDKTSKTTERAARFNGGCRTCKARHSIVVKTIHVRSFKGFDMFGNPRHATVTTYANRDPIVCCGRDVTLREVRGIKSDAVCGSKCLHSKGFQCECSCAGKNHGAGTGA